MTEKEKKQRAKDIAKVSVGAPLAALGGWAAFRGAPILRGKIKNISDGEFVSNYLQFANNFLGKTYAGKKAISHHRNILKGKPEDSSVLEESLSKIMVPPKAKDDNFSSRHYVGFSEEPKKALDFWGEELKWSKVYRGSQGKKDPKTLKRVARKKENFEKDFSVFKKEIEEAPDIHTGLRNAKKPESKKMLRLLRAEKRRPGEIMYPSMMAGAGATGLGGSALVIDGIRKKASKEEKKKKPKSAKEVIKEHSNVAVPAAAGVGLAATPKAREKYLKKYKADIDPKSNKLVIVTEGGKHNPGGGGHAAAADAIAGEYDKIHGKGSAKVINFNDYSKLRNEPLSKFNKNRYLGMTSPDNSPKRRYANMLGFLGGTGPMRWSDKKRLQKEIKGAGRVITTQPDAVNYLRPLGVAPELAVTDYGVGRGHAKDFWRAAYGLGKSKEPEAITKAFTPSEEAKKVFSQMGTPTKDVPSVPVSGKFLNKGKGKGKKKKKLKELELFDNKGNPTGKKVPIDPKKKLVVVTGGSTGLDVDSITKQVANTKRKDLQVVGISGKNEKVLKNMGKGTIAQGYEKNFDKLLDSADMVLSRPHGLSTTEALSKAKPVIPITTHNKVDSYAPHMVGNAETFSKMQKGAPIGVINDKGSVEKAVNEVADNLDKYRANAKQTSKDIGRNAAKMIAEEASSTKNLDYKMPRHYKAPFYIAAAGAGTVAAINQIRNSRKKKKKEKKVG